MFICDKKVLSAALSAAKFTSKKARYLPALDCFLLAAAGGSMAPGGLSVTFTNLETRVTVFVEGEGELERPVLVDAAKLKAAVQAVKEKQMSFAAVLDGLKVGATVFPVGIDAGEFPMAQECGELVFAVDAQELAQAVGRVVGAAATHEIRPVLCTILSQVRDNQLSLVATDGFCIAKATLKAEGVKDGSWLVPAASWMAVERALKGQRGEVLVSVNEAATALSVALEGNRVTSSLMSDGVWPNYEQILPKEFGSELVINQADALAALAQVEAVAKLAAGMVSVHLNGSAEFSAQSGDMRAESVVAKASWSGEPITVAYNVNYLRAGLLACPEERVAMRFQDVNPALRPVSIDQPGYLYVLMPMQIFDR